MKNILLVIIILVFVSCHKSEPTPEPVRKYFNPTDLSELALDSVDMQSEFYLFQEIFTKPISLDEQIYQRWRRDNKTNKLMLIQNEKSIKPTDFGASSDQYWYRKSISGVNDNIEINIVISNSDDELTKTIKYYTQEKFSGLIIETEVPFAGQKSWIPADLSPTDNYYSVMFYKYNVFIMLHVSIRDKTSIESQNIAKELAIKLEKNIDTFANEIIL